MRPEDIAALLQKQPFQPFRLHRTDGRTVDVRHPRLVGVARTYLFVGQAAWNGPPDIFDRFEFVQLENIQRLELLSVGQYP